MRELDSLGEFSFRIVAAVICVLMLANGDRVSPPTSKLKLFSPAFIIHAESLFALTARPTSTKSTSPTAPRAASLSGPFANAESRPTSSLASLPSLLSDQSRQSGPLSLFFLDPGMLVVGGSTASGGALVRSYELPDEGKVLSASQSNSRDNASTSFAAAANSSVACTSLTRTHPNDAIPDALVLVVRTGDGRASLFKARVQAGVLGQLQPFSSTVLSLRRGIFRCDRHEQFGPNRRRPWAIGGRPRYPEEQWRSAHFFQSIRRRQRARA